MIGCPMLFCSAMICFGLPLLGQGLQPFALDGIVHSVGTVHRHNCARGHVEHEEDSVVVRPAPIAADDVFVAGFGLRPSVDCSCFADSPEDAALPVDEQGQIFLIECRFGHIQSRRFDFRGIDVRIFAGWHLPGCPIRSLRILATIEQRS